LNHVRVPSVKQRILLEDKIITVVIVFSKN